MQAFWWLWVSQISDRLAVLAFKLPKQRRLQASGVLGFRVLGLTRLGSRGSLGFSTFRVHSLDMLKYGDGGETKVLQTLNPEPRTLNPKP